MGGWRIRAHSTLSPAIQIDNETGVEIFYNLPATPWFRVTADIQWIDPARADFAHAWVGGLRANVQY